MRASIFTVGYLNPKLYPNLKFIGNITQVNVWGRILSELDISSISNCFEDKLGDLVSWTDLWVNVYSKNIFIPLEHLCHETVIKEIRLLPRMTYSESAYLCEGLGGFLTIPKTHEEVSTLVTKHRTNINFQCGAFWAGVWDTLTEGVWLDHKTELEIIGIPWAPDEPNGVHIENCAGLDLEGYIDDKCDAER